MTALARNLREQAEQCQREISEAERLLRDGHPDIQGLMRARLDWMAELAILRGYPMRENSSLERTNEL